MKNTWIIVLITALVVGGAAFFGGTKYAQGKSASVSANNFTSRARGQGAGAALRRAGNAGGFTMGEVLSKDDKSLTVKLRDGGSKIIFFSTSTPVRKTSEGTISDVVVGSPITIIGQAGTEGSIVANTIQLGDFRSAGIPGNQGRQQNN